ncbi:MAG: type I-E CRISPR-associated protein Cse1/CasA [Chlamydiota bacterium]
MENHFNLIDEPWIPVADVGFVSLQEIFSNHSLKALGGNPVQKIAVTKLLLAIAQSAYTPQDDEDWQQLGAQGLSEVCLDYLHHWYDSFYLYGEKPFLQIKAVSEAAIQPFGAVLPEVATGNTTLLTEIQQEKPLNDAEKALVVLQLMGFGLGGKKTDNSVVLTPGYRGKTKENGKQTTGSTGTSLGFKGYLHNFIQGVSICETLWLNLIPHLNLQEHLHFTAGIGKAPWEQMPEGEDDQVARDLTFSLMGRLIPMSRFVLLADEGIHYTEGISHLNYKDGMADPSVSISYLKNKVIWVDPQKRPWRMLTSLLSFMSSASSKEKYNCMQLEYGLKHATEELQEVALWSGGLAVSSNAGEQYVSGSDDFVESLIKLPVEVLGSSWFQRLKEEMEGLDGLSKFLYGCVLSYYKVLKTEGRAQASRATNLFWQLSESRFQELLMVLIDAKEVERYQLRKNFAGFVYQVYGQLCPRETSRQLDAWSQCRPNIGKYLSKE